MASYKTAFVVLFFVACATIVSGQNGYERVYQITTVFNTTDCTGGAIYASFENAGGDCEFSQCQYNGVFGQSVRQDCQYGFLGPAYSLGAPSTDFSVLTTTTHFYVLDVNFEDYEYDDSATSACNGMPSSGNLNTANDYLADGNLGITTGTYEFNQTNYDTCLNSYNFVFQNLNVSAKYNCTNGFLTAYTYTVLDCVEINGTITKQCNAFCATADASFLAPLVNFALLLLVAMVTFAVSHNL